MRTKIRLSLDLGIQLAFISLLLLQIGTSPEQAIQHIGIFAFLISIWQVFHAVYVVQKYQDWYRGEYLKNIKRVVLASILFLGIGGSIVALTLGSLLPFVIQCTQVLGLGLSLVLAILAFQYFGRSIVNLYAYYHRPRSFWDL